MIKNSSNIPVILFLGIILFACNSNSATKTNHGKDSAVIKSFSESPLPSNEMQVYLRKISLKDLNKGAEQFEIRVWKSFILDSFPVILERYYLSNGNLNGEVYFFSGNNGGLIDNVKTLQDEKTFKYVKRTFANLPIKYVDSLIGPYSLLGIDSFDVKKILRHNEAGYVLGMPNKVLIEQATNSKVISIFITTPHSFVLLDKNIAACSAFMNFTRDKMLFFYPDVKQWYEEQVEKVF